MAEFIYQMYQARKAHGDKGDFGRCHAVVLPRR